MQAETAHLSDEERVDWLRLIRTERVGPRTFRALMSQYGSAASVLEALPEISRRGGRKAPLQPHSAEAARHELEQILSHGARLIGLSEESYPVALSAIEDAPPLLCVQGNLPLLNRDCVAVVGARNASALGLRIAGEIAAGLGDAGLPVVSGLARGIDTAAHEAALESGTIAVVAGGIDIVYPPENENLMAAIPEAGAVISEMPFGTRPGTSHFPRRNRIISGLSRGVVVIEAAHRSGSLITARLATEQGREVFAVPGSPKDPRAEGTNRLIREGAVLTRSVSDVVEALDPMLQSLDEDVSESRRFHAAQAAAPVRDSGLPHVDESTRSTIAGLIGVSPVAIDDVVRASGLPTGSVMAVLLELELAGRLNRHPGQRVSLIPTSAQE